MQTTLRIDDELYREAKAEAARQGVTLTRFLEEGLRLRLEPRLHASGQGHSFRVYEKPPGSPAPPEAELISRVAEEEQEQADMEKLGLKAKGPEEGRS